MRAMTDADDASIDASETGEQRPATSAARLLDLQRVDTASDQLIHRRERLAERDELATASEALKEWERSRASMRARMDELTAVIEQAESDAAEVATHKVRLEAQMKTVIAPREAEALMHEISGLDEQTDALDTRELEALEEQSDLDDRLTEHLRSESALREAVTAADQALQRATSEIDVELEGLVHQRDGRRAELDQATIARYDRIRSSSGVAVAQLVGHRCDGCHLDLSAAEVDDVKDEAKDEAAGPVGVAECPNCGRILVV